MGAVWLARDDVLGRQVAIKRVGMMPGGATPDLERAEREARLAARLNHPHVVAVFDLVADDEGQWLVMEYVEGITLAGLVARDGALRPDQVSPLLAQAADALAAAHESGIVHRDVKPSNILVTADGQVKLSDFGIARAEADASLTQTGLVTGSPAYLAPEVASGEAATDASDVWSLGATAFHALAGHPPYEVGDNLLGALYRIVHEEPPRIDDAGWLAPLLEATMTRDPADRWPMAKVRDFLAAGPEGTPISPEPDTIPDPTPHTQVMAPPPAEPTEPEPIASEPTPTPDPSPAPTPQRRRRSLLPLAAVIVVALLIGVIVWAWLTGDETPRATPPDGEGSSQTEPTASESESEASGPTAEGMETFIADYLATAPESPQATFEMLTPRFQEASGGFGGYSGYWNTIQSAELVEATADPEAMTVAYTVDYVKIDGEEVTDEVVLRLVYRNDRYLIAEES